MNFAEFFKNPAFWTALGSGVAAVGTVVTGHGSWSTALTTVISALASIFLVKQNTVQGEQIKAHRAELASMGRKC